MKNLTLCFLFNFVLAVCAGNEVANIIDFIAHEAWGLHPALASRAPFSSGGACIASLQLAISSIGPGLPNSTSPKGGIIFFTSWEPSISADYLSKSM